MKIRFEWTIPNMLSILRLLLVPVFSVLYLLSESRPELLYWAIGVLVVSGLSDAVDGYIARRFNQISES
ncbi:MAG: CDP-alcohol phosphatidyltransferase family protein, partial [Clostridia bacterium]|nr:CDP-alcohol phosphatidyltransferase family protein [Clostridia bacterium]